MVIYFLEIALPAIAPIRVRRMKIHRGILNGSVKLEDGVEKKRL
jgi:hypothetical protein